jgi:hypothetical protein
LLEAFQDAANLGDATARLSDIGKTIAPEHFIWHGWAMGNRSPKAAVSRIVPATYGEHEVSLDVYKREQHPFFVAFTIRYEPNRIYR